jgi:hypothetical protein
LSSSFASCSSPSPWEKKSRLRLSNDYNAKLPLPTTLPDGYYVLRLSTVGKSDQDEHSSIVETYAKSVAGVLTVVDSAEYFSKSHANQGVQL